MMKYSIGLYSGFKYSFEEKKESIKDKSKLIGCRRAVEEPIKNHNKKQSNLDMVSVSFPVHDFFCYLRFQKTNNQDIATLVYSKRKVGPSDLDDAFDLDNKVPRKAIVFNGTNSDIIRYLSCSPNGDLFYLDENMPELKMIYQYAHIDLSMSLCYVANSLGFEVKNNVPKVRGTHATFSK